MSDASPFDLEGLIRDRVRDVPDHPKPGVTFKDITPLLADRVAFGSVIDAIVAHHGRGTVDKVVGIEARGFILASPVAYHFGAGFVPVRKEGKLPAETYAASYELEYGTETLEVDRNVFELGERVLVVDDVLATGGTAQATAELVRRAGAEVIGVSVLLELSFLGGRRKLSDVNFFTLITV